jgi:hypothetical protein
VVDQQHILHARIAAARIELGLKLLQTGAQGGGAVDDGKAGGLTNANS